MVVEGPFPLSLGVPVHPPCHPLIRPSHHFLRTYSSSSRRLESYIRHLVGEFESYDQFGRITTQLDLCDVAAGLCCIAGHVAGDGLRAAVDLYDSDGNGSVNLTEVRVDCLPQDWDWARASAHGHDAP